MIKFLGDLFPPKAIIKETSEEVVLINAWLYKTFVLLCYL